jgi:hypothetical protein
MYTDKVQFQQNACLFLRSMGLDVEKWWPPGPDNKGGLLCSTAPAERFLKGMLTIYNIGPSTCGHAEVRKAYPSRKTSQSAHVCGERSSLCGGEDLSALPSRIPMAFLEVFAMIYLSSINLLRPIQTFLCSAFGTCVRAVVGLLKRQERRVDCV